MIFICSHFALYMPYIIIFFLSALVCMQFRLSFLAYIDELMTVFIITAKTMNHFVPYYKIRTFESCFINMRYKLMIAPPIQTYISHRVRLHDHIILSGKQ